jgi:hypothetical protein
MDVLKDKYFPLGISLSMSVSAKHFHGMIFALPAAFVDTTETSRSKFVVKFQPK